MNNYESVSSVCVPNKPVPFREKMANHLNTLGHSAFPSMNPAVGIPFGNSNVLSMPMPGASGVGAEAGGFSSLNNKQMHNTGFGSNEGVASHIQVVRNASDQTFTQEFGKGHLMFVRPKSGPSGLKLVTVSECKSLSSLNLELFTNPHQYKGADDILRQWRLYGWCDNVQPGSDNFRSSKWIPLRLNALVGGCARNVFNYWMNHGHSGLRGRVPNDTEGVHLWLVLKLMHFPGVDKRDHFGKRKEGGRKMVTGSTPKKGRPGAIRTQDDTDIASQSIYESVRARLNPSTPSATRTFIANDLSAAIPLPRAATPSAPPRTPATAATVAASPRVPWIQPEKETQDDVNEEKLFAVPSSRTRTVHMEHEPTQREYVGEEEPKDFVHDGFRYQFVPWSTASPSGPTNEEAGCIDIDYGAFGDVLRVGQTIAVHSRSEYKPGLVSSFVHPTSIQDLTTDIGLQPKMDAWFSR